MLAAARCMTQVSHLSPSLCSPTITTGGFAGRAKSSSTGSSSGGPASSTADGWSSETSDGPGDDASMLTSSSSSVSVPLLLVARLLRFAGRRCAAPSPRASEGCLQHSDARLHMQQTALWSASVTLN